MILHITKVIGLINFKRYTFASCNPNNCSIIILEIFKQHKWWRYRTVGWKLMTLLFCLTGTQIGCKEKEKQFQNLDFSNHVLVSWLFLAYRRLTFSMINVTILTIIFSSVYLWPLDWLRHIKTEIKNFTDRTEMY